MYCFMLRLLFHVLFHAEANVSRIVSCVFQAIVSCVFYCFMYCFSCVFQADAEARRNQLMKDMAQLRLQDEVKRLEGSLQAADKPNLPPYLVLDALALSESTPLVKQLANSARFITIIPLAGKCEPIHT